MLLFTCLLGYHIVRTVAAALRLLRPAPQFGWLAHIAYVGGAFGTFVFTDKLAFVGLLAGLTALVQRLRGRSIQPFGIAMVGLLVSALAVAYWVYIESMFWFARRNGG